MSGIPLPHLLPFLSFVYSRKGYPSQERTQSSPRSCEKRFLTDLGLVNSRVLMFRNDEGEIAPSRSCNLHWIHPPVAHHCDGPFSSANMLIGSGEKMCLC